MIPIEFQSWLFRMLVLCQSKLILDTSALKLLTLANLHLATLCFFCKIVLILLYQDGCTWVWKDGFIANCMKESLINEFF